MYVLPAVSAIKPVTVWVPFATVVEFQVNEYGDVVSVPTDTPSILKETPETPDSASLAVAERVTAFPETVALAAGAVIDPVGATLSSWNGERDLTGFSVLLALSRE